MGHLQTQAGPGSLPAVLALQENPACSRGNGPRGREIRDPHLPRHGMCWVASCTCSASPGGKLWAHMGPSCTRGAKNPQDEPQTPAAPCPAARAMRTHHVLHVGGRGGHLRPHLVVVVQDGAHLAGGQGAAAAAAGHPGTRSRPRPRAAGRGQELGGVGQREGASLVRQPAEHAGEAEVQAQPRHRSPASWSAEQSPGQAARENTARTSARSRASPCPQRRWKRVCFCPFRNRSWITLLTTRRSCTLVTVTSPGVAGSWLACLGVSFKKKAAQTLPQLFLLSQLPARQG